MCETPVVVNTVHVQYKFIVSSDIYSTSYCDGDTTCYVLTIPVSTSAPPLTVEQVLKHLQGVKNWREVGEWLLGFGNRTKLDAIEREYTVDEDRFQAVVQQWLEGGGRPPSWRRLVWYLDGAGDITAADPIRGFAEPPQGESF